MEEVIRDKYGVTLKSATDIDLRVVSDLPLDNYIQTTYDIDHVLKNFTETLFQGFKEIEEDSTDPYSYWSIDPRKTTLELFIGKFVHARTLPGALLKMEEYAKKEGDIHSTPSSDFEEFFGEVIDSMAIYRNLLELKSTKEKVVDDKNSLFPSTEELEDAIKNEAEEAYIGRDKDLLERVIDKYNDPSWGWNYLIPYPAVDVI